MEKADGAKTSETGPYAYNTVEEDEYAPIDLDALIRFHVYVRDALDERVPLSFRSFMKGVGSHRTMVMAVNAIEEKAKQLMMVRAVLDEENRKTGRHTDSFEEAQTMNTRREPGMITSYGRAWADLGRYLGDIIDLMVAGGEDPEYLRDFIRQQSNALRPLADAIKRYNSPKLDKS